jgi:hypothetical protein
MKKEYEVTFAKFHSECNQYYEVSDNIAIEDIRFIKFTELLETANVFKNTKYCRYEGTGLKNNKWSLLGYSFTNDIVSDEDDEDDDANSQKEYEWNFTFFNGFFSSENSIINSKKSDIIKAVSDTAKFIEATLSGNSKFIVKDYHPISELQEHVLNLDKKKLLDRIDICIITDNLLEHENLENKIFIESLQRECKIHYWGINKWTDLSRSKSKRLPIHIDFTQNDKFKYELPYLERKKSDDIKFYLSIFPGDLIADLYEEFGTQLLENNVRVFLSLKNKYNKPMSHTINDSTNSGMFFSYNNGLSITASSIKINKESNKIESITDLQIVNGGQTTATLFHTKYNRNKILRNSLNDIYVQVKITVLRKSENYADLIKNISKYANSQTAIKPSDFWTNDAYLIECEKLSLRNHIQKDGNFIYYFFERMAGQYKETKERKGTPRDQAAWEKQNPKKLLFNKIDLGRWINALNQPNISVQSADNQFGTFMKSKNKPILTDSRFKTIIGFGQLCERARIVCGKGSKSIIGDPDVGMNTSIYAMSYLHYITNGKFDYHKIYDQRIDINELDSLLATIIKKCWDQIYRYDSLHPRDKTKTEACWIFVKERIELSKTTLEKLNQYTISSKEHKKRESKDLSEEEYYFTNLKQLLSNNGKSLYSMQDIAVSNNNFYKYRTLVKNTIERIKSKNGVITLAKLKELIAFKEDLKDYNLSGKDKLPVKIDLDFLRINEIVFSSRTSFIENLEKVVASKSGDDFEKHMLLMEEIKELTEKFDLYPGLSIIDMERIEHILDIFNM